MPLPPSPIEWQYASIDCSGGNQTILNAPALVYGAIVVTAPSAAFVLADDTTDVIKVPASASIGVKYGEFPLRFETSLKVEASGTGLITVVYKPLR